MLRAIYYILEKRLACTSSTHFVVTFMVCAGIIVVAGVVASSAVPTTVMDTNADGHLTREELSAHLEQTRDKVFPDHHSRVEQSFNSIDTNKDGWIDFEEHLTSVAQLIESVQSSQSYVAPEVRTIQRE